MLEMLLTVPLERLARFDSADDLGARLRLGFCQQATADFGAEVMGGDRAVVERGLLQLRSVTVWSLRCTRR